MKCKENGLGIKSRQIFAIRKNCSIIETSNRKHYR